MSVEKNMNLARYMKALHAIQSAVAFEIARSDGSAGATPKHLRVGINSAMINADAFLQLLVDKNITTEEEFSKYLADAAEKELKRYQDQYPNVTFA